MFTLLLPYNSGYRTFRQDRHFVAGHDLDGQFVFNPLGKATATGALEQGRTRSFGDEHGAREENRTPDLRITSPKRGRKRGYSIGRYEIPSCRVTSRANIRVRALDDD